MKSNLGGFVLILLLLGSGIAQAMPVPSAGGTVDEIQPEYGGEETLEEHIAAEKRANIIIIFCLTALTLLNGGF